MNPAEIIEIDISAGHGICCRGLGLQNTDQLEPRRHAVSVTEKHRHTKRVPVAISWYKTKGSSHRHRDKDATMIASPLLEKNFFAYATPKGMETCANSENPGQRELFP